MKEAFKYDLPPSRVVIEKLYIVQIFLLFVDTKALQNIGLTDGEIRAYLALIELGPSTTGPITDKSNVSSSKIYHILEKLIQKGLVSFVVKEKTRYYQSAEPSRLLDYIEQKKQQLDQDKKEISKILPKLKLMQNMAPKTEIAMFSGFKGLQTAFEHHEDKLKKGDEYLCFGGYPTQKDIYHIYWKRHHLDRIKKGIKARMLFDKDVKPDIMKNRNKYKGCDTRHMHKKLKTPAWIFIYKDTTTIFLQENPDFRNMESLAVEIVNQEIADTFKTIFEDYWAKTKPFKT